MNTNEKIQTEAIQEELQQQKSSKSSENKAQSCEVEELEGTPVAIIHDREKDVYFGAIGMMKVSPDFKDVKQCKNYNKTVRWEHISALLEYGVFKNYEPKINQ